jgi:alpha 1,3-glucosidase
MWQDPFTLIIALGKEGTASGKLYLDDGEGYEYQNGAYILRQFDFSGHSLRSTAKPSQPMVHSQSTGVEKYDPTGNSWAQAISHVKVERIVITGLKSEPKSIRVGGKLDLEYSYEKGVSSDSKKGGLASRLVIKNPGVGVVEDWEIILA